MRWLPRRRQKHRHLANYEGVLGTSLELSVIAESEKAGPEAEQKILAEIDRQEAIFSVYKPDSEFNLWQATRGEPRSVSQDLAIVLAEAERWRILSKGAFLPTVEALTRAWRRRAAGESNFELPLVNTQAPMWEVNLESLTATRLTEHPASLNAIAKGYIVDRAVDAAIKIETVSHVMVNIGGDLKHFGEGAVRVAIADPARPAENSPALCHVNLSNQAIASSGGYRRGFQIEDGWFSHIFDPAKAEPVEKLRNASVIAQTAMLADILATIVGVLPPDAGMAFADAHESVGAMVVDSAGHCHQNGYWNKHRVAG